jgi:hypothetical protein
MERGGNYKCRNRGRDEGKNEMGGGGCRVNGWLKREDGRERIRKKLSKERKVLIRE